MPESPQHPKPAGKRLGMGMIAAAWVILLGLLALFFGDRLEELRNPNQQVESAVLTGGVREVTLRRNRAGHYVATGLINGQPVEFLLDTGATTVSIPENVAHRLGLSRGPPMLASTANGVITTYATRLGRVALGDIEVDNVGANINPGMGGGAVLLGMSFLKNLEFTQRGNTLTLRQNP
jgi:aspartyl protease family protein